VPQRPRQDQVSDVLWAGHELFYLKSETLFFLKAADSSFRPPYSTDGDQRSSFYCGKKKIFPYTTFYLTLLFGPARKLFLFRGQASGVNNLLFHDTKKGSIVRIKTRVRIVALLNNNLEKD
jgi:hypothetical protein